MARPGSLWHPLLNLHATPWFVWALGGAAQRKVARQVIWRATFCSNGQPGNGMRRRKKLPAGLVQKAAISGNTWSNLRSTQVMVTRCGSNFDHHLGLVHNSWRFRHLHLPAA